MALLNREQIAAAGNDPVYEDVEVPEWGGEIRVKGLKSRERDNWEKSRIANKRTGEVSLDNFRASLLCECIVCENLNPIFTQKDVLMLGEKNAAAIDKMFTVAQRLSGLSNKDIEDLQKNSDTTPTD